MTGRFVETIESGNVALDELEQFAPLTPSGITTDSEERLLYEHVLFADTGLQRSTDIDRRRTMLLILELAWQLGRGPNVDEVRWAFYSRCLPNGEPLQLPVGLDHQQGRWWVYQANDLAHICFENLLKFLLDLLEPHPAGLTPGALIRQAVAEIVTTAGDRPETWSELLKQTTPAANAASDEVPLAERTLTDGVLRAARAGNQQQCPPEAAWQALQLLAVLCKRTEALHANVLSELAEFENGAFRSLLTEVRFLRAHGELPFDQMLGRLLQERVVRRHLWIALRKLRYQNDYTFLFEPDNGRIRLRAKDGPVFTNPRLGPALTFLKDIHLIGEAGLTLLGQHRIAQT